MCMSGDNNNCFALSYAAILLCDAIVGNVARVFGVVVAILTAKCIYFGDMFLLLATHSCDYMHTKKDMH